MTQPDSPLTQLYLTDLRTRMRGVKALGEGTLSPLGEDEWHTVLSDAGNGAAVIVQHLSGNMLE
ncbi:DUF1572 family protein [Deinococcus sp.]|uniref:DUF1572 family protein n=1 Tax=Deinococcus sp. TaxID=47478 RepID=UPI003B5C8702